MDLERLKRRLSTIGANVRQMTSTIDRCKVSVYFPEKESKAARRIEYGNTKNAPQPFMRETIATKGEEWKREIRNVIVNGMGQANSGIVSALRVCAEKISRDFDDSMNRLKERDARYLRGKLKVEVTV